MKDFNGLKELIITDQLKKKVPYEIRDHFIDSWTKITKPSELADKIDEYESVRRTCKKQTNPNMKQGNSELHKTFKKVVPQEYKRLDNRQPPGEGKIRPRYTCFRCGVPGHLS